MRSMPKLLIVHVENNIGLRIGSYSHEYLDMALQSKPINCSCMQSDYCKIDQLAASVIIFVTEVSYNFCTSNTRNIYVNLT